MISFIKQLVSCFMGNEWVARLGDPHRAPGLKRSEGSRRMGVRRDRTRSFPSAGPAPGIRGFSALEVVLYVALSAIIVGVTVPILRTHINAYSFITNRHTALSDVSYALNRISHELLRVETADITAIAADSIEFVDDDGIATEFSVAANGTVNALYRGNELLLSPVQTFAMEYYDLNNNVTANITDIRKFEITITTAAVSNEGTITLSTHVMPRAFIYENYQ